MAPALPFAAPSACPAGASDPGHRLEAPQEKLHGGLTPAQKRTLAGLAAELRETGDVAGNPATRMKPGTKLVREWRGETHTVLVLEDGFEGKGEHRPSLSSIAQEITGTHCSGPRFFGLKCRPKPLVEKAHDDA